ncbi:unnamed protein product [Peronospora belbahrii]|uniref:Telomerase reverse transcriptase n=1 Tax=Peronospora belbahrii TaxID=622444 RepID=A0ABN8CVS0_9STRA|nr:unnamed protein product [Peronospora belbahrii]
MEALLAKAVTLRSFLQSAAEVLRLNGDVTLEQNLSSVTNEDVSNALDQTFLIQSFPEGIESFPRSPWNCKQCISHTELVHHVIERLLARKRSMDWKNANILTLGYREVAPDVAGHRVMQSNGIMCYYPNTLVAALKKPLWKSLHKLTGDDLMTHLLLNYTIFVQLKDAPDSYMQIAGKSLRLQTRYAPNSALDTANRDLSINCVMYARYFRKDRVFATSHVLVKASKTGDPISRTEASRVLRSMFTDAAGQKRLSRRLINLIPTVQAMVSRFKACQVEELAKNLTPLNAEFRKFMADNPDIKRKIGERAAKTAASPKPILMPIVRKALDDGYLSQGEVVTPSSDRKRKRREEAIEMLSCASASSPKRGKGDAERATETYQSTRNGKAHEPIDLTKLQQHKDNIKKLLTFATPKKKVYRLVRKFVARVVPKEMWGSSDTKKNWKCVKMMLRKFIFSRKFDIFSLKKCVGELQMIQVEWMKVQKDAKFCPPNERVKRQKLFKDLLWWMMSLLVFPLLQNLFYITEAEGMANEIAYYQRPVWNVISMLAVDDLEREILQPSANRTASSNHKQRLLPTSRLRLLPKASGIRPLMNLSASADRTKVSVNRSMESVHRILTFEMARQPKRLLGASVRSIDEIYKRLKPLFRQIASCPHCTKRQRTSGGDIPMAYCVTVDVERCFDTIRPRKLYQMLKKAIQEDEYLIRKHWVGHQVTPIALSNDSGTSLLQPSFFYKLERPAYPSGEFLSFDELVAQSPKKNSLFVDGVLYDYLTKTKALELLKEHLSANTIEIDGHEYVQQCGIPQGSVLSTTLCNIYYAQFERRVLRKRLPEVCDSVVLPVSCCQHEELFRYTDDFMYITTDLKRARAFSEVMHGGNNEYGCFVNLSKTQANFELATGTGEPAKSATSRSISWCGMLIDPSQLQIYVNYEKLSSSLLQGSIPFNETKAAREFFVNKVVLPIRQRWHALYFDPELFSEDTILVNLFQMLIVAAHRFSTLVEMLPFVNRDMHFFHKCILQILKKMTKGIHHSLELDVAESDSANPSRSYAVKQHQVWTIGLDVFQFTIRAKRDQVDAKQRRLQGKANWNQLLDTVRFEQGKYRHRMKKNPNIGLRCTYDLNWLLHDDRNASVLKQFLLLDVDSLAYEQKLSRSSR